jgi:glycosyltransferase involved in cell wall biosynthesis
MSVNAEQSNALPVSVLMPVHNCARFLEEAVESVLNQTFSDFEFIIVNDGSTDSSPDLLKTYAEKDSRIRILTNDTNKGIVFSLNRGLEECRGKYIVRMDADDIALPERIEKQVARIDKDDQIAALGSALTYIDASDRELGIVRGCEIRSSLLHANPMLHPTVVIRREFLKKHGLLYIEKYRYAEDYYLWLQISRLGKLDAMDDVLVKYRLSDDATRLARLKGVLWATLKVKKDAVMKLGIRPLPGDVMWFLIEALAMVVPTVLIRHVYCGLVLGINRKVTR